MELELNHLALYLPYKLMMRFMHPKVEYQKVGVLNNIYNCDDDVKLSINYSDDEHIWMFKPMLRPLSDLSKVEYLEIFVQSDIDNILNAYQADNSLQTIEFYLVQKLASLHFDIFGLIENDLALDINEYI